MFNTKSTIQSNLIAGAAVAALMLATQGAWAQQAAPAPQNTPNDADSGTSDKGAYSTGHLNGSTEIAPMPNSAGNAPNPTTGTNATSGSSSPGTSSMGQSSMGQSSMGQSSMGQSSTGVGMTGAAGSGATGQAGGSAGATGGAAGGASGGAAGAGGPGK